MSEPAKARALPEFVDDLVRIGVDRMTKILGTEPKLAEAVMHQVTAAILDQYAKASLYVPAGFGYRNDEIYRKYGQASDKAAAYSRDRVEELAAEYELTARQVYAIIAAMRSKEQAARQDFLPGFTPPN